MRAEELMAFDYVRHKKTKEIIWIFEIDADRGVINNEADGYNSERNISIDDIEPIPLTLDILEKNRKLINDKRILCCQLDSIGITYIHQLQHLLRLLGIEGEIKL